MTASIVRRVRTMRHGVQGEGTRMTGRRPAGVTLVAILAIISGALSILGSVLVFSVGGGTVIVAAGIVSLIIGIVTFLIGFFLLRGSQAARILTTIVLILSVVDALY